MEPLETARLSALAYSTTLKEIKPWKLIQKIENHNANASCSIFKNRSKICITFEGTDSVKDLKSIFNLKRTKKVINDETVKIHTGFLNAYKSLHMSILNSLTDIKFNEITLTGHSMGGAMCDIAFLYLKDICKKISIHTYASPKSGNIKFSKYVLDNCNEYKRFVIKRDMVSCLPPNIFGYKHATPVISLDRVSSRIIDTHFFSAIDNHAILNYIKSIMIWTLEQEVIKENDVKQKDLISYE